MLSSLWFTSQNDEGMVCYGVSLGEGISSMQLLLIGLVTGILTGGVYALMSSGLTLIFGVLDIINIAHAILVIAGAYLSYVLATQWHIDPFLGLLITMPAMFALGVVLEWAFIRRLKRNRIMLSILVTYAIALVVEGILSIYYGTTLVTFRVSYTDASIPLPFFRFDSGQLYYLSVVSILTFLLAVVLLTALYVLVYRTKFGFALRATMQDRVASMLIGIKVDRVQTISFGIGIALCAAGGMAYGASNVFNPATSYDLITRLLVIIVLGGMGSLTGALIGSFVMVSIGNIVALFWAPIWSTFVFFLVLIVLLIFRPQGIFGRAEGRSL